MTEMKLCCPHILTIFKHERDTNMGHEVVSYRFFLEIM